MIFKNKYNNYELHPYTEIKGYNDHAWEDYDSVISKLKQNIGEKESAVVCFDLYPGVNKEEIIALARKLKPDILIDMEELAKSEEVLNREFRDFITDDRVFGIMCHKRLEDFFDFEKMAAARQQLSIQKKGLVVIAGVGAGLLREGDITVYCDITRWEVQLRYREGMPNWHCTNYDAPNLEKYKRGFFIEWRLADRYKKERFESFDYILETEEKGNPKLITGEAFRAGLKELSRRPFRLEPYFDPGVWGGHWMKEHFNLDKEKENFAWSFDGVPEENAINLAFGEVKVKLPAIDLVFYCPKDLLGERVYGRFGTEFPIRFDLLDTMGGGNLSLQVHPMMEYIQDAFGMHYTQDESYYLLDTDEDEDTYVYLGVKKSVDKDAMARDLREAEIGKIQFPAETYINEIPVKKHDHILIPAGTIHCSGKNTMVLEISATPYIFTFKLWDWGRVGLDGIPRPTHVDHGLKNIQWERDTDWIYNEIVHQEQILEEREGMKLERTGLHNQEFINTFRYTFTVPVSVKMEDSVQMMNLVEGESASIESVDGTFQPFEVHYAETVIVPASVGEYRIVPGNGMCMMIIAEIRK